MPLFFFISGFLYYKKDDFVIRKVHSLLIPYFSFSIIWYIYWWLLESKFRSADGTIDYFSQLLNIFIPHQSYQFNVVLWFLPCLCLVNLLFYFFFEKVRMQIITIFVGSAFLSYSLEILGYRIMLIENTLGALPFFAAGFYLKDRVVNSENRVIFNLSSFSYRYSFVFLLLLTVVLPFMGRNDLGNSNFAFNYIVFLLFGLIYIYILFFVLCSIKKAPNIVLWLSKNSLILMLIHEPIKRIILVLYEKVSGYDVLYVRNSIIHSFIILLITVVIMIPFVVIINKKFPFLIGK